MVFIPNIIVIWVIMNYGDQKKEKFVRKKN